MGGMAIGAVQPAVGTLDEPAARLRHRRSAIGLAAMVFHPAFTGLTGIAYDSLLPGLHEATGSETATALLKWLLAAGLILPQSILLGMTFPLMSAGIIRRQPPQTPGETLAMLYFTNSFGAAIGVLASGFLHDRAPGTARHHDGRWRHQPAAGRLRLVPHPRRRPAPRSCLPRGQSRRTGSALRPAAADRSPHRRSRSPDRRHRRSLALAPPPIPSS